MSTSTSTSNAPRPADSLLVQISDYITQPAAFSDESYATSRLCLMDSLGCAFQALDFPECTKLLGPVVPGAELPRGARVPGTSYQLDPVQAAFNIGILIRWLDYNDTWLAAEWGHPSDNFGGLLAVADYQNRTGTTPHGKPWRVRDLLTAAIQAYEIQGILALENSFNRVGLDHVLLVRVASTAVITRMLGGNHQQVLDAISQAWIDGGALRTYRHAPNTGSRKSWAAGDATRRGVQLALWVMAGERGYSTALSAPQWGFEPVLMRGRPLTIPRPFHCYVMEQILFKVAYPAEFHAQTAAEAAVILHPLVKEKLADIQSIRIETHESAMRIINKTGPLRNPADRDHCLQYITAVALRYGTLTAQHYEDAAADRMIDALREKMMVVEVPQYSRDYLDPDKRSIANAVQVTFKDGTQTPRVEVEYPLGHRRRRQESILPLQEKFRSNAGTRFTPEEVSRFVELLSDATRLDELPVDQLIDLFATPASSSIDPGREEPA